jgi:hypothetical protein
MGYISRWYNIEDESDLIDEEDSESTGFYTRRRSLTVPCRHPLPSKLPTLNHDVNLPLHVNFVFQMESGTAKFITSHAGLPRAASLQCTYKWMI